jgi:hypothetical protein
MKVDTIEYQITISSEDFIELLVIKQNHELLLHDLKYIQKRINDFKVFVKNVEIEDEENIKWDILTKGSVFNQSYDFISKYGQGNDYTIKEGKNRGMSLRLFLRSWFKKGT